MALPNFDANPPAFLELVNLRPPTTTITPTTITPTEFGFAEIFVCSILIMIFIALLVLIGIVCALPANNRIGQIIFFWDHVEVAADANDEEFDNEELEDGHFVARRVNFAPLQDPQDL